MFIDKNILERTHHYQEIFTNSKPFKHLVIDNFLKPDIINQLVKDFPSFDPQKAISETGKVGGKAVYENISEISLTYHQLAKYINSQDFLTSISGLTGIEGLIDDPTFYGGGTHENLNGQELDPHVDFNMDERRWYHRRLNLIIFLNPEWEESWGGSLELHSDPRQPDLNEVQGFIPLYNRCVIFETNEYSWHGFSKICLPENKQHLSRKSISIYLYTKERPSLEIAPSHTTFYIPRPLPAHIQPNSILTEADYQEIQILLKRRNDLIYFYQQRELKDSAELKSLKSSLKRYLAVSSPRSQKILQTLLELNYQIKTLLKKIRDKLLGI